MTISLNVLLKSAIGISASALFGVSLVKVIATQNGPEGIGTFGLYRQFFQFLAVFFTLGNGFSIIEGISKSKNTKEFLRSSSTYTFYTSIILSILVLVFQTHLSLAIFSSTDFVGLISWTPIFIIFMSYHGLIKTALSGEGKVGTSGLLTALPFLIMLLSACFTIDLINLYLLSSLLSFLIAFIFFKQRDSLRPFLLFRRNISFERTSISTILTGAAGFLGLLFVKSFVTHQLGINQTGLLEACWSLVNYTTLIFLTSLSVYYLPKISIEHNPAFRNHFFILVNALGIGGLGTLLIADDFFIKLLFTKEFALMSNLLFLMAIGEYLKCLNWFFIFSMIGLSYKKSYISLDIISNIFFITVVQFSNIQRIEDIGVFYILFQALYLLGNLILNRKFKIIPFRIIAMNLFVGIFLWGVLWRIKAHAY